MRVNEIFYSIQGEGRFTGTPAIFIRFAGCNLACDFCDTDHEPHEVLSEEDIMQRIAAYPAAHVVLTGGEPTLQLTSSLLDKLHAAGKFVQIETNGTVALKDGLESLIDWITCSPKHKDVRIRRIDELKVVYQGQDMSRYAGLQPTHPECRYLQPCDVKDCVANKENLNKTIDYIKANPKWKLSIQTQKILNVR